MSRRTKLVFVRPKVPPWEQQNVTNRSHHPFMSTETSRFSASTRKKGCKVSPDRLFMFSHSSFCKAEKGVPYTDYQTTDKEIYNSDNKNNKLFLFSNIKTLFAAIRTQLIFHKTKYSATIAKKIISSRICTNISFTFATKNLRLRAKRFTNSEFKCMRSNRFTQRVDPVRSFPIASAYVFKRNVELEVVTQVI